MRFFVVSIYAFGKWFLSKKQNKIRQIKLVINSCSCNKKIVIINKKNNNKIECLEIKLNKVMKVVRILKDNQMTDVTPD